MNTLPPWLDEPQLPAWLDDGATPAWLRGPSAGHTPAERAARERMAMEAAERAHRLRDAQLGRAHIPARERMLTSARGRALAMRQPSMYGPTGRPTIMGAWIPDDVMRQAGIPDVRQAAARLEACLDRF